MRLGDAESWPSAAIGFFLGLIAGVVIAKWDVLVFDERVPVADFASVVISVSVLLLVPVVLGRLERRGHFDRRAIAEHLEPAKGSLHEIDDAVLEITADAIDSTVLKALVRHVKNVRQNLERARTIAADSKKFSSLVTDLETASMLASRLNKVVTGGKPFTERAEARHVSTELLRSLQQLLRILA